jgi:hypothetical protein
VAHPIINGSYQQRYPTVNDNREWALVLSHGSEFKIFWTDNRLNIAMGGPDGIYESRIGDGDDLVSESAWCSPDRAGRYLDGCATSSSFLLVWNVYAYIEKISGMALGFDGVPLSEEPFQVGTATSSESLTQISVACNDQDHLLAVWERVVGGPHYGVYGSLFLADGTILSDSFEIARHDELSYQQPSVASVGSNFMVIFEREKQSGDTSEDDGGIFAVPIDSDGSVLDPEPIPIWTAPKYYCPTMRRRIISDGTAYLTAFYVYGSLGGSTNGVCLARLTPDGTVLDVPPVSGNGLPAGFTVWGNPLWNGSEFTLWWADSLADDELVLRKCRLSRELNVLETEDVSPCYRSGAYWFWNDRPDLSVGCNEDGAYLAAWKDCRQLGGEYIYALRIPAPVAPQLTLGEDDHFQLQWDSTAGTSYAIWSSTELIGPWTQEALISSEGISTSWRDPDSSPLRKFYRIESNR